jgi:hypothetical protein
LGYDPLEVNPEDMVRKAVEEPQVSPQFMILYILLSVPPVLNSGWLHDHHFFLSM